MAEQENAPIMIREIDRFTMFAPPINEQAKSARLAWAIRDKNPRISVFLNSKEYQGAAGILNAPMNPETFFILLDLFEKVVKGEPGKSCHVSCFSSYNPEKGAVVPTDRILVSDVHIGRDEFGICWIKVVVPNKPEVKFEYHLSDYHQIYKLDGSPVTKAEASQLQTLATINALRYIYYGLVGELRATRTAANTSYNSSSKTSNDSASFSDDIGF